MLSTCNLVVYFVMFSFELLNLLDLISDQPVDLGMEHVGNDCYLGMEHGANGCYLGMEHVVNGRYLGMEHVKNDCYLGWNMGRMVAI